MCDVKARTYSEYPQVIHYFIHIFHFFAKFHENSARIFAPENPIVDSFVDNSCINRAGTDPPVFRISIMADSPRFPNLDHPLRSMRKAASGGLEPTRPGFAGDLPAANRAKKPGPASRLFEFRLGWQPTFGISRAFEPRQAIDRQRAARRRGRGSGSPPILLRARAHREIAIQGPSECALPEPWRMFASCLSRTRLRDDAAACRPSTPACAAA